MSDNPSSLRKRIGPFDTRLLAKMEARGDLVVITGRIVKCHFALQGASGPVDQTPFIKRQEAAGGESSPRCSARLAGYEGEAKKGYRDGSARQSMLMGEVETIWANIAERDDWAPLHAKLAAIKSLAPALGEPPRPAGHPA